jgi:thiamine transport system permease protein
MPKRLLYLLPIAFFILFYFYPMAAILNLSFRPEGQLNLSALGQLWESAYYGRVLWFTVWQAVLSTLLTLVLAFPSAYIFAHYTFPGKNLLRAIITLPFVLPTIVVASAFLALIGPNGLLNQALMGLFNLTEPPLQIHYTIWAILLAHIFYNYSIVLRLISNFWQNLPHNLKEAGQILGASPWQTFWTVTFPLLWPAISSAALLVFIFCFTSFGVILILGGPRFATLEVEIYQQAVYFFNLPVAAALSLIQIIFTFILMWVYTYTQAKMARPLNLQASQSHQKSLKSAWVKLGVGTILGAMFIFLVAPLLALVWQSVATPEGLSGRYYQALSLNQRGSILFVPPLEAIANSLGFAAMTVVLALSLGLISSHLLTREKQRWVKFFDPISMLPLTTSAVTLGFGYIVALNKPPLDLRTSLWLVPIAHTLVGLPFVIRSLLPVMRSIRPSLREAGAILGANPTQVWLEIDWPLIRRALLVGAVFAFTISMGEFGATLFIGRPDTPTLPIAIYRFLSQPGAINYGQAMAMSSILLLVCAIGFIAIEHFRLGNEGEF